MSDIEFGTNVTSEFPRTEHSRSKGKERKKRIKTHCAIVVGPIGCVSTIRN